MSKIKIEFSIIGDNFLPEDITTILNIKPTEAYYKNEDFLGGKENNILMKRKGCAWSLATEYAESLDVVFEIRKLYNILKNKKAELLDISLKFSVSYKFDIVIYIGGDNPIIGIEKEIVKFASDISAEFEFDTYV